MAKLIIDGQESYIKNDWHYVDFRHVANGYDTETFTDDELIEAMESVVDRFDANYGITWETLEAALDRIISDRKQEKQNDDSK